jgi:hypothetical protein
MSGAAQGELRQFRALVRLFAYRFFDTEILSLRGEISALLGQLAALMMALSFLIVLLTAPKYAGIFVYLPPAKLPAAALADEEFVIATGMAVIGIFTLLLWDALFPDRRDCMILGALPLRIRTLFAAKLAALGGALSLATVAVHSFTGLVLPFVTLPSGSGLFGALRSLAAWWTVMFLASAFVFLFLLCVHGFAVQLLPHAWFLRWSSILQCAAFFAVLALYFLAPPRAGALPAGWFLGLFQVLNGSADAVYRQPAARATVGVAGVALLAGILYVLAYARQMRRTLQQAGIAPLQRNRAAVWPAAMARLLTRLPTERAILAFIARTVARSRQHRLLLAIYAGMGLAYTFSQIATLMYHPQSRSWNTAVEAQRVELAIPMVLLFFVLIGLRVSFSIPIEVRANWIFRLTDSFSAEVYLPAARRALIVFALAPVMTLSATTYAVLWPWQKTLEHVAFLTVFGLLIIELSLTGFAKVPFTCAYLPGKANLKVMFGVYWALLIGVSEFVSSVERDALRNGRRWAVMMTFVVAAWLWAARRTRNARTAIAAVNFDEQPDAPILTLGLRQAPGGP